MIEPYKIICPCSYQDSHKNTKLIIQCTSCKNYQHKYCMKSMVKMSGYQCPYCQLKKGALFFNILYSLIDPTLIEFNSTNKNLTFLNIPVIEQIKTQVDTLGNNLYKQKNILEKNNNYFGNDEYDEENIYKSSSHLRNEKFDEINRISEKLYNKLLEKEKKLKILKQERSKFLYEENE